MPSSAPQPLDTTTPGRVRVRYAFPGDGSPLEDVVIGWEDGIITEIHTGPDATAKNLGDAIAIPALINAHTHLEFSDRTDPLPNPLPFTSWIGDLLADRQARTMSSRERMQRGIDESLHSGVRGLCEIGTEPWPNGLRCNNLEVLRFQEVLGLTPERIAEQRALLPNAESLPDTDRSDVQVGISPHAPYSVHPDFYAELIAMADRHRLPVSVHLGETLAERELIEHGTGEFRDMLTNFGIWQPGLFPSGSLRDYLEPLGRNAPALVVHGNHLNDDELDAIAKRETLTLVYCPRTHRYFRHAAHPFRTLLERGGRVAVGTDGRGSNPDLSIWEELRFVAATHPDLSTEAVLKMGTAAAADAVGWTQRGRLAVGAVADILILSPTTRNGSSSLW